MCGVCGEYRYADRSPADLPRLREVNAALTHRGPDDAGEFSDGPFAFAMRRLSVIDLATGHQPLANEDDTVWTVFNGEIYNHAELRADLEARGHRFKTKADTEVIVHLYEEKGPDFVEALNGMFGLAVWDRKARTLTLARDRAGVKPLYYAETPQGLVFASEFRALLRWGVDRTLDLPAVMEYVGSGYCLSPRTPLRAVRKLPPGHRLVCGPDGYEVQPFWRWPRPAPAFKSRADARAAFRGVLTSVLRRQVRADVPVGLFLSGGTDSRLLAAVAARELALPLPALSVGFDDRRFDETPVARASAEALGLPLERVAFAEPDALAAVTAALAAGDEPLMDYSFIPTYLMCRAARGRFKVMLAGDGGDELFGGYPTHGLGGAAGLYRLLPTGAQAAFRRFAQSLPARQGYISLDEKLKRFTEAAPWPPGQAHARYKAMLPEEALRGLWVHPPADDAFAGFARYYDEAAALGLGPVRRLQYVDFKTFLPEDCLSKGDRASMAHGLEVRVPFLDNEVIDFAARLPEAWNVQGAKLKIFLKSMLAEYLPPALVRLPKRGFTPPMAAWLRGPLAGLVADLLAPDRLRRQGLFRPEAVQALLDEHRAMRHDHSRALWGLAVLSRWLDELGAGRAATPASGTAV